MKTAMGYSVAFLLFLLAYSTNGYSGSAGNGSSQRLPRRTVGDRSRITRPAATALLQNSGPAGSGAVALNAIPLGESPQPAVYYAPLPVITTGGNALSLTVAKGSRVQVYVDVRRRGRW